jgi:hypothetical protein
MEIVERFAAEVAAFEEWAERGTDTGDQAVRNALRHLTRLYLSGLDLPDLDFELVQAEEDARREQAVAEVNAHPPKFRLPIDWYYVVYDPHKVPPDEDEPGIGSLADDLGDIFKDVVKGLRLYQAGWPASAVWDWRFLFWAHWGDHAASANRALHFWLSTYGGSE